MNSVVGILVVKFPITLGLCPMRVRGLSIPHEVTVQFSLTQEHFLFSAFSVQTS